MTTPAYQRERGRVAEALRALRVGAALSGARLAEMLGWQQSKVPKNRGWSAGRSACILETVYVQFLVLKKSRESAGGWLVKTMTYSESRAHYAETLNAVVDDREEVVITRAGHEPVVIVALADYESLKETAYLLRSPENARRLLASIDRLEHGGGIERDLLE